MAWVCYLLECADGTLYTGISNDLSRRLGQHSRGVASKYTRTRLPVRLRYTEKHPTRSSALRSEAAIKCLPRARKLALCRRRRRARRSVEDK